MKRIIQQSRWLIALNVSMLLMASMATAQQQPASDPLHPDYIIAPLQPWEKQFVLFEFKAKYAEGHVLPYRLYVPPKVVSAKRYPLVLFFHGAGERGFDNRKQFMRFPTVPFWEKTPCFILAPQCPVQEKGQPDGENVWVQTSFGAKSHQMKASPSWPMKLAIELLDSIVANNNVDTTRIYVTGMSMGGYATWEILQRKGNLFAAAAPVCGGGDLAYAAQLINIPIWAFHGDADSTVPASRSIDMIKAIESKGGTKAKLTLYPGVGHGAWTPTYNNAAVWDWLFAQQKKK